MRRIKIGNKYVGKDDPCLVMVDAGVNHNNDIDRALGLVNAAADGGADVIKFQTYKASAITTKKAPRYWNPKLDQDGGGTQHDTFSRIDDLPLEAYAEIKRVAVDRDIIFSSTPFNLTDVEFLNDLGMDMFKISSSDLTYHQLLKVVAQTNKPVILSTGTASVGEMEEAINVIEKEGNSDIILQHCILSYPCGDQDANLAKMVKMQQVFDGIPVGYSDHTLGDVIPVSAVSLGARTIEKHFTLDKSLPDSPDHGLSVDPDELKEMMRRIRRVENGLGTFVNGPYEAEMKAYQYARKSVTSCMHIPKGMVITRDMLTAKRPGTGIYPKFMDLVVGRVAKLDIPDDETITFDLLA